MLIIYIISFLFIVYVIYIIINSENASCCEAKGIRSAGEKSKRMKKC